ncbi:MAG: polymer-forming cytoskeletal protein [Lachnospiraceae bacterium]|nr:polymer-forming cytoskeletal protein [Lachnospiraceae bacterium]
MGFFSDLKDDLSQAVNDLKPEDEGMEATGLSEGSTAEIELPADIGELSNDELDAMLDNLEAASEHSGTDASPEASDQGDYRDSYQDTAFDAAPAAGPSFAPVSPSGNRIAADEVSTIMHSMIINGNMATEGSLEILGSVVGNVEALGKLNITGTIQGDSSAAEIFAEGAKITGDVRSLGPIKVGQSSVIIGNISATSAVIAGAVKGDIDVKGPVILDASAIVMGNIKSKSVQINNGAVIEGMCSQCYAEVNPTSFFEELKKMK